MLKIFRISFVPIFLGSLVLTCCRHAPDYIKQKARFTMDQFIGVNAFVDDPIDKLQPVGFVREYHNWEWDEGGKLSFYPNNQIQWSPGIWNFDEFYKKVNDAGIDISPCIQGNVEWLRPPKGSRSDKPLDEKGADPTAPSSYEKKSHHMYQFAARYGSTRVADTKLTLAANQPRLAGLNYIRYLEDWNEQNKTWEGKNAQFSPDEYAAMLSADYDGHCNTMLNGTFGIKNADRNLKVVMGGLAGLKLDFVKNMQSWFRENRKDKRFAADVINFHIYAFKDEDKGWEGGGPAISPEDAKFKEGFQEIVQYRNEHLPEVEVWASEFGWDTNPRSPLCPPRIGSYDIQEVQAQWIVRSYLAFAAAGVDRAQLYMLRDVDSNSPIWYASCGLTRAKGDWAPKKSWYYVYTLKNTIANMKFDTEVSSGNSDVLVYKFSNSDKSQSVYALWLKTSEGKVFRNFNLNLADKTRDAEIIELKPGKTHGTTRRTILQKGKLQLDVTERPVFVRIKNI